MSTPTTGGVGFCPSLSDCTELLGQLPDVGTSWQQHGVTHWHLTRSESATTARDRFEADRWVGIVGRPAAVVHDPRQALAWLLDQQVDALARASDLGWALARRGWTTRERWLDHAMVSWETLSQGWHVPSGMGIAIRDGYSVELYANPRTSTECSLH